MLLITLLFSLTLITGCSSNKGSDAKTLIAKMNQSPDVSLLKDGTILYRGLITFTGYELLKLEYEQAQSPRTQAKIRIKSLGGYSFAGMLIGDFIHKNKIPIIIDQYCFSACANYIFPASPQKTMHNNALVGLHPGRQLSLNKEKFLTREELLAEYDEALLYDDINVSVVLKGKKDKGDNGKKAHNKNNKDIKPVEVAKVIKYFPEYQSYCGKPTFETLPSRNDALVKLKQYKIKCFDYEDKVHQAFYQKLGVNPQYPHFGEAKLKKAQNENELAIKFFYYDAASIKKLGINDVNFPKNWDPSKNSQYETMVEVTQKDWQTVAVSQ